MPNKRSRKKDSEIHKRARPVKITGRVRAGATVKIPKHTNFRGKRYTVIPGHFSSSKSVALKFARSRRELGKPTIVRAVNSPKTKKRTGFTIHVLYGRNK